jgi:hypothetical protein
MSKLQLQLHPGRFYLDRDGFTWCCYRVERLREEHRQADCIRVVDSRTEYFYIDGRYDEKGKREHCLVTELSQ